MLGRLVVLGLTALSGISVYIGPSPREREKKREMTDESKNVQTTPPAPTAVGPCPTLIQHSRTPWHWKFTQPHCATRQPQYALSLLFALVFWWKFLPGYYPTTKQKSLLLVNYSIF